MLESNVPYVAAYESRLTQLIDTAATQGIFAGPDDPAHPSGQVVDPTTGKEPVES